MIALAVLLPTIAVAYLAAWRIADEWPLRHRLAWGPWLSLWAAVILSAVGFGVAILWLEILVIYLGHMPHWGLRFYAPAIETVAALDVLSLAVTAINHAVLRSLRGQPFFRWRPDVDDVADVAGDLVEGLPGPRGGIGGRGGVGVVDTGVVDVGGGSGGSLGSGGSGGSWPGFGLDLDLGEEGAILAVGVFVFLVAALLVSLSLVGGGFATYAVLRAHTRVR